jgi:DedD protein
MGARAADGEGGARRTRARDAAPDPVLPEKKRARRRLVGAIALALAVAVGLPMLLDSEPKPLASDIAIQIPSKDKPADAAQAAAVPASRVDAADALDKSEEIVKDAPLAHAPAAKPAAVATPAAPLVAPVTSPVVAPVLAAAPQAAEPKPHADAAKPAKDSVKESLKESSRAAEAKLEADAKAKAEAKAKAKAEEIRHAKAEADAKAEAEAKARLDARRAAEAKLAESKHAKPDAEAKPKSEDAARAMAILEDKPSDTKYLVQVAAVATQEKVDELQGKLKEAGIKSFTQKVTTASGALTRIRVGPFPNKEEAEKVRAKLSKIGLSSSLATS